MRSPVARIALALVVCAAGATVGGCTDDGGDAVPEVTVPADWPSFTDPGTDVDYRLPGEHESTTQRVQLPDGQQSEIVVYRYTDGDRELIVSTFPLDPETFDLDSAPGGAADAVGGEVVSVRELETAGFASRNSEIHFSLHGSDWLLLNRAVLIDGALVQLQASGPRGERAELVVLHEQVVAGFTPP